MKSWRTNSRGQNCSKKEKNLVIIDGLNLAFRYTKEENFASKYIAEIQSIAADFSSAQTIVLTDKGKSIFRTNILPEYKANREEKRANKTPEEKEAEKRFFQAYKEAWTLAEKVFTTFCREGVEADDLAAFIVEFIGGNYDNVWLVSTDGDWDCMLSDTVKRYSYKTNRVYSVDTMYEDHGCDTVDQFISLKALQGDLGDNIRGVEGVGVKRGYSLIREYGSASNIADSIPLPGTQKFIQAVNNSEEIINRNLQLVDLLSFCGEAIEAAGYLDELKEKLLEIE